MGQHGTMRRVKLIEMPVKRYWTSYWRKHGWFRNPEYEPVSISAGSFRKRRVSAGDVLYIVSQDAGQLLLGGRMTVGRVVTRDEAVRVSNRIDLYDMDEWVVAHEGSGSLLHLHRRLAPEVTKQIRLVSENSDTGSAALHFVDDRNLDRQTLRVVRELTAESVSLLDEIIEMTDAGKAPIMVSDDNLRRYRAGRDLAMALHEEIPGGTVYVEGSVKHVLVNRYERDPNAREACIRHHGEVCSACGLDLKAVYGQIAAGFIHVHHLIQLSRVGSGYVVDPVEDLRPVCPNCHAIIHRSDPPYSIGDVMRFIESCRAGGKR